MPLRTRFYVFFVRLLVKIAGESQKPSTPSDRYSAWLVMFLIVWLVSSVGMFRCLVFPHRVPRCWRCVLADPPDTLSEALRAALYNNTQLLVLLLFVLNHLVHGNILSLVYPLATFTYAAIESPTAPRVRVTIPQCSVCVHPCCAGLGGCWRLTLFCPVGELAQKFWVAALMYTDLVIFAKYFFQFTFFCTFHTPLGTTFGAGAVCGSDLEPPVH